MISFSFFFSFFEKLWENWESLLCHLKVKVKVAQLCLTLCDPMEYTVPGILLARILWSVAFPFSRGSSQPRNRTQVSPIADRFFTSWATSEALWRRLCHEEYAIWRRLQMKKKMALGVILVLMKECGLLSQAHLCSNINSFRIVLTYITVNKSLKLSTFPCLNL